MENLGLKLRMIVVGSILFGFYLIASIVFASLFGVALWPVLLAGIVVLPALQYKLGKWLAIRSVSAEDMPETGRFQELHFMTESLSRDMGIEKPRLMIADMGVPNAFATGRRGAGIVVVSRELLTVLDKDEVEGVIAHELAHIKNRDVITMVIGQSIATLVGYAAFIIVRGMGQRNMASFFLAYAASILANFIVMIFVLAISRYREYVADNDAKRHIGSGDPLARALEKISRASEGKEANFDDSLNALCILNTDRSLMQRILSTHPPMEKRIERLRT